MVIAEFLQWGDKTDSIEISLSFRIRVACLPLRTIDPCVKISLSVVTSPSLLRRL